MMRETAVRQHFEAKFSLSLRHITCTYNTLAYNHTYHHHNNNTHTHTHAHSHTQPAHDMCSPVNIICLLGNTAILVSTDPTIPLEEVALPTGDDRSIVRAAMDWLQSSVKKRLGENTVVEIGWQLLKGSQDCFVVYHKTSGNNERAIDYFKDLSISGDAVIVKTYSLSAPLTHSAIYPHEHT